MGSLPEPPRYEIEIDETRVARGHVDRESVRVTIDLRKLGSVPSVVAALEDLPKPADLVLLKAAWSASMHRESEKSYSQETRLPVYGVLGNPAA
jgi:hypothetical protein